MGKPLLGKLVKVDLDGPEGPCILVCCNVSEEEARKAAGGMINASKLGYRLLYEVATEQSASVGEDPK